MCIKTCAVSTRLFHGGLGLRLCTCTFPVGVGVRTEHTTHQEVLVGLAVEQ